MAAKVLIVKVTRKHIREGRHGVGGGADCPIALATKELTRQECGVTELRTRVGNYSASPRFFRNSLAAQKFIKRFDGGQRVSPATFRLREMERTAYL